MNYTYKNKKELKVLTQVTALGRQARANCNSDGGNFEGEVTAANDK